MKLLPLIGALLISTTSVQALETLEDLDNACGASEEVFKLCTGLLSRSAARIGFGYLCQLREEGVITPEAFAAEYNKAAAGPGQSPTEFMKAMWNSGIKEVLEDYPNCPIKPLP